MSLVILGQIYRENPQLGISSVRGGIENAAPKDPDYSYLMLHNHASKFRNSSRVRSASRRVSLSVPAFITRCLGTTTVRVVSVW